MYNKYSNKVLILENYQYQKERTKNLAVKTNFNVSCSNMHKVKHGIVHVEMFNFRIRTRSNDYYFYDV